MVAAHAGQLRPGAARGLIRERLARHLVAGGAAELLERAAAGLDVAGQGRQLPARRDAAELVQGIHGDADRAGRCAGLGRRGDGGLPLLPAAGRKEGAGEKEEQEDVWALAHGA